MRVFWSGAILAAILTGCAGQQVSIPTADVLGVVAKAATCVAAVNAARRRTRSVGRP